MSEAGARPVSKQRDKGPNPRPSGSTTCNMTDTTTSPTLTTPTTQHQDNNNEWTTVYHNKKKRKKINSGATTSEGEMEAEETHQPTQTRIYEGRRRLQFPQDCTKTPAELYTWFAALMKQNPELEPLFKEGRNRPYITAKSDVPAYNKLIKEGYSGIVLVPVTEVRQQSVIIHSVPTYINVNLIETPEDFLWLKRRTIGKTTRPQLLGAVMGNVPNEVHLVGLGRFRCELYVHEPDMCKNCSRWGHQEWCCRTAPKCRYCAGNHKSTICSTKIQAGTFIPPKCCNCGGAHNAHSHICPRKPVIQRQTEGTSTGRLQVMFRAAPPPQHSAWGNKGVASAPSHEHFPPLPTLSIAAAATPASTAASTPAPAPTMTQNVVRVKTVTASPLNITKSVKTPSTAGNEESASQEFAKMMKLITDLTSAVKENGKQIADLEKATTQRMDAYEEASNKRLDRMQQLLDEMTGKKTTKLARTPVQQAEKEGEDTTMETSSETEPKSDLEMDSNHSGDTSSQEDAPRKVSQRRHHRRSQTIREQPKRVNNQEDEEVTHQKFEIFMAEMVSTMKTMNQQIVNMKQKMDNDQQLN
ncbi:hypothetical protein Pmani_010082 [Petrolisthes manimaculis]|uniref:Gag-like protein n=4 Tax=Petrolisthes manimaculis TaxID=1843537 RepID=A0AAE1UG17_9EUCA|nr:hypothetical protein Pmani_010030 [Petrolisthes manimaculis]KAK4318996.1 hypothetical protein Pmani_010082 [Petrolisthes manimaculis]